MTEQIIVESFQNYLKEKGFDKKSLSLFDLLPLFINYYQKVKFDEFSQQDESDMLLFQYGTYRRQEEEYFQINFTRQLYKVYEDEFHQIYQLEITFLYFPQNFSDVVSFSKWSTTVPDLSLFYNEIVNSNGFKKALNETPLQMEITVDLL